MDDRNVKIGVGMMLRQAAEFGEAQAERRANDLDMRLQVALLANQELRSHIAELEAQLSRGVFVREMSDEDLVGIWRSHSPDGRIHPVAFARACIAAATKLPEGSVRWTEDAYVRDRVVYDSEDRPVDGIEVDVADSGGVIHHVYVPEPVDSPETAR